MLAPPSECQVLGIMPVVSISTSDPAIFRIAGSTKPRMMARSPSCGHRSTASPLAESKTTLPRPLLTPNPTNVVAPVSIGIGGIDAWMKVNAFLGSSQFLEP